MAIEYTGLSLAILISAKAAGKMRADLLHLRTENPRVVRFDRAALPFMGLVFAAG